MWTVWPLGPGTKAKKGLPTSKNGFQLSTESRKNKKNPYSRFSHGSEKLEKKRQKWLIGNWMQSPISWKGLHIKGHNRKTSVNLPPGEVLPSPGTREKVTRISEKTKNLIGGVLKIVPQNRREGGHEELERKPRRKLPGG